MGEWATWIELSALGRMVRGGVWLYPMANVLHVLGIAGLLGGIAVFDIAVLRKGAASTVTATVASIALPLAFAGAGVAVLSGILLFAADARALVANPAFWIKATLMLGAVGNALLWHSRPAPPPAQAALSLFLWIGVAAAGRLIAYI